MVLIGIITVYLNGIILLHLQKKKKTIVKFCVLVTVTRTDPAHCRCWAEYRAQFCALNWGLGLAFHTFPRAHVCIADLGVCGSFECVYERGQVALETCMVRRLPMIPSLDST